MRSFVLDSKVLFLSNLSRKRFAYFFVKLQKYLQFFHTHTHTSAREQNADFERKAIPAIPHLALLDDQNMPTRLPQALAQRLGLLRR
jgi:hypothetical protein